MISSPRTATGAFGPGPTGVGLYVKKNEPPRSPLLHPLMNPSLGGRMGMGMAAALNMASSPKTGSPFSLTALSTSLTACTSPVFSSDGSGGLIGALGRSFEERPRLEAQFFRDFFCCDQNLHDLHGLLEHFEECHVTFEPADGGEGEWQACGGAGAGGACDGADDDASLDMELGMEMEIDSVVEDEYGPEKQYSRAMKVSGVRPTLPRMTIGSLRRLERAAQHSPYEDSSGSQYGDSDDQAAVGTGGGSVAPSLLFPPLSDPSEAGDMSDAAAAAAAKTGAPTGSGVPAAVPQDAGVVVGSGVQVSPSGRLYTPPSEKPFRCSVPGCDKRYKQQNGLKYHRLHGHCNQNALKEKSGGVGPNGEAGAGAGAGAVPGGPMAEGKPYVCHVESCGKKYKNMNGLRYHYQHSGSHGAHGLKLLSTASHPPPQFPPGHRRLVASSRSSRASSPAM